jgi:thiosulfate reductase cytochrome b subunit
VIGGEWAIRDCETCHTDDSRLAMPLSLGSRTPGGITPAPGDDQTVQWNGSIERDDAGTLWFAPQTDTPVARLYIFGHDSVELIDTLGVIVVLLASFGVTVHATLRVIAGRRRIAHTQVALRHEYMYSLYERQWHWLQTFVILGLIFTGMVIHRPAMFPLFSFAWMVEVHNVFALLLVINAALALFYHLASGEIKQFIPRPYGFFDDMIEQALYYLRGIFKGDEHPFEKRRDRKMNPIQQLTYLALLNVLLPLQIVTGALIWGAQQFPALTATLGGLPVLAPFHTLIAWLLVTFVIVHVYMTTTGHTPLANIRAMVMGYDDVEVHEEKLTAVDSAAQAGEPTG